MVTLMALSRDLARRLLGLEQRRADAQRLTVAQARGANGAPALAVFNALLDAYPAPAGFEGESLMGRFAAAMATHPTLRAAIADRHAAEPGPLWAKLLHLAARVQADAQPG